MSSGIIDSGKDESLEKEMITYWKIGFVLL